MSYTRREPRTKEELLDRLVARDFNGDLSAVVGGEGTSIVRKGPNKLLVSAPSGRAYELVVRLPRTENPRGESRAFGQTDQDDDWTAQPGEGQQEKRRGRQAPEGRHQERSRPSPRE